jgi:hypothetical protein
VTQRSVMVAGLVGTCGLHALLLSVLILGPALTRPLVLDRDPGPDFLSLLAIPDGNLENADGHRNARFAPPKFAPRIAAVKLEPPLMPMVHIDAGPTDQTSASSKILERSAFVKACHERYADAASYRRDLAAVNLQEGALHISGGDHDGALMALRCLQAIGTVGPGAMTESPGL